MQQGKINVDLIQWNISNRVDLWMYKRAFVISKLLIIMQSFLGFIIGTIIMHEDIYIILVSLLEYFFFRLVREK
jgi:hypothetical protein